MQCKFKDDGTGEQCHSEAVPTNSRCPLHLKRVKPSPEPVMVVKKRGIKRPTHSTKRNRKM
jgi:hypothetical protein